MKRRVIACVLAFMMGISLGGCDESDVTDQIANVVQVEDENVLSVKGATPDAYPNKTYGEAFDSFFGSPTWKYFVGTSEGPDENEDGQPDYTEENVDVVEFTGYCTYQDVEVKARIQFTLDKEAGTFEATYLSLNEVPQNGLMLVTLIEKAFTNEAIDAGIETEQQSNVSNEAKSNEPKYSEADIENMLQTTDLRFPILFQGYAGSTQCPVMVNDENETATELSMGTYQEMLASCVDDGVTMYASPVLHNGDIYTATKWDAPDSEWYDGLLTYEEFLKVIEQIVIAYEEDGISEFYTSLGWESANKLAGRWSGGTTDLSVSIYSDFSDAELNAEIGTWELSGTNLSGRVRVSGNCGDIIRVVCVTESGAEMELVCSGDSMRVQNVSGDIGIEDGTQLTCIEQYQS